MKIDVFNHVFPTAFLDRAETLMPSAAIKRWKAMAELYDMDARMKVIDPVDAPHVLPIPIETFISQSLFRDKFTKAPRVLC